MDGRRFDHLARTCSAIGTRRGLVRVLAALPVASGLAALFGEEGVAKRKRKAKRRVGSENHKHKGKRRKHKNHQEKNRKHECKPTSTAKTCASKCGSVKNNCKKTVDCGSCECEPACPVCQICDATTGACVPEQQGAECGEPGQICQDGACACDDASCGACATCQGDGFCASPCNGIGCCDGTTCQDGNDSAACGTGGNACTVCTGTDRCGGGGTDGVCGCTPIDPCTAGVCGSIADGCGGIVACPPCPAGQICGNHVCTGCSATNPCPSGQVCCASACLTGTCCTDAQCPAATPICDGNTCVRCTEHGQCGADALCAEGQCQTCTVTCPEDAANRCGGSLQAALAAAGSAPVVVCPGRYTGNFTITAGVRVIGAGDGDDPAVDTILDAQGNGRVLAIPVGGTGTVTLAHLRFTGGVDDGGGGGGILNFDVRPLAMTRCTVSGNHSTDFGLGGGIRNAFTLTLTDCRIENNIADGEGGGIFTHGTTTLLGSTVVRGNTAARHGGGLAVFSGTVEIGADCQVTENTAPLGQGGGIYVFTQEGAAVTLENDQIVTDNIGGNCAGGPIDNCDG